MILRKCQKSQGDTVVAPVPGPPSGGHASWHACLVAICRVQLKFTRLKSWLSHPGCDLWALLGLMWTHLCHSTQARVLSYVLIMVGGNIPTTKGTANRRNQALRTKVRTSLETVTYWPAFEQWSANITGHTLLSQPTFMPITVWGSLHWLHEGIKKKNSLA